MGKNKEKQRKTGETGEEKSVKNIYVYSPFVIQDVIFVQVEGE